MQIIKDPHFTVEVISQTPNPQQVMYAAMHQDYDEGFVAHERNEWPSESHAGEIVVNSLLKGGRGHYGPLEHPQIVLNVGWFPHSTMQQIRTHRVGVSFDVQSFRYTGQRIIDVAEGRRDVEEVFYLRPQGWYTDRQGKRYEYTANERHQDSQWCAEASQQYRRKILKGFAEEHARGLIPFDIRQHWVMSANVRSLMHLLMIRGKADVQIEAQKMCEMMLPHFVEWCPNVGNWFVENLWLKGRLAP